MPARHPLPLVRGAGVTAAWSDPGHRHPRWSRSSFKLSVEQGCFKRTQYLHRLSSALPRDCANPKSGLEDTRTAVWTTSKLQMGAEPPAPLQDTQPLPPSRPLLAKSRKTSGTASPGPCPAGSAARSCPALPAASHPLQRVNRGRARLFRPPNPLRTDPHCSVRPPHLPSTGWEWPQLHGRSTARHGDRGSAGPAPGLPGLSEAWEAGERGTLDTGAGSGPAGARPAQTGSCYQLMAAWQRARRED